MAFLWSWHKQYDARQNVFLLIWTKANPHSRAKPLFYLIGLACLSSVECPCRRCLKQAQHRWCVVEGQIVFTMNTLKQKRGVWLVKKLWKSVSIKILFHFRYRILWVTQGSCRAFYEPLLESISVIKSSTFQNSSYFLRFFMHISCYAYFFNFSLILILHNHMN